MAKSRKRDEKDVSHLFVKGHQMTVLISSP